MKKIIFAFIIPCLSVACTILKNGISYSGEEGIFAKSVAQYPTQYRLVEYGEPNFELGIEFKSHKNGRIKGIRIKNPQSGNLRLSFWDADEKKLISTYTFNNGNPGKYNFGYFQIPVKANRTYCLTINVREYYYHVLTFDKLPLNLQEISLTNSVYAEGKYQRYPEFKVDNVIHGLIDLDFEWEVEKKIYGRH
ncbi:protein of unknown function [Pedobacter steynii]|uniref:DUF4082 domain-containing protein n=1 Tax=Pedobacter steynii TaxID=430522 RepID=A0A1G9UHI3_9SPHI|nr:DUF4082 domain-containing protein [Pedobacter steynii]NQX40765.1 DUF4082 domain-containing protein [Pedobacter steynii]SDM59224.1 protein of unknown function [Pedobacter steynii]